MSRLRATIVALLTLAVATLPAAGAGASMVSSMSSSGDGMDCAKHEAAMAKSDDQAGPHAKADAVTPNPVKDHCADHAACGKCLCLGLTAVLSEGTGPQQARLPLPATVRIAVSLIGPAYLPPSPPPRL